MSTATELAASAQLAAVSAACQAVHSAMDDLDAAVVAARDAGLSWGDIGAATGMTRQAAHGRWDPVIKGRCTQGTCGCLDHGAGCGCGHDRRSRHGLRAKASG